MNGVRNLIAMAREEQRQLIAALRGRHPYCHNGQPNYPLAGQCRCQRDLYLDLARKASSH